MARATTHINDQPPPPADAPRLGRALLTTAEVAKLLGGDVSVRTLEKWRRTGDGPDFVPISSKMVRYRLQAIDRWLDAKERSSNQRVA